MPEVLGKDPFEERINIILDEISLGIQWDRPSLIVIVYRSEFIIKNIQTRLEKSLNLSGQSILNYLVDKSHYDIPLELMEHPQHKSTVYFIRGIRWGGGRGYSNAYRALNMHREYLVEGSIKAIFFVSEREARQLSRFAPDFWAFRHKVVEFFEVPSKNHPTRVKSSKRFHALYSRHAADFQKLIKAAEQSQAQGCLDEALQNYRRTLRKYPEETVVKLQIAEIYLSMGWVPAAKRILKNAGNNNHGGEFFLRELTRLHREAGKIQPATGGFSEYLPGK